MKSASRCRYRRLSKDFSRESRFSSPQLPTLSSFLIFITSVTRIEVKGVRTRFAALESRPPVRQGERGARRVERTSNAGFSRVEDENGRIEGRPWSSFSPSDSTFFPFSPFLSFSLLSSVSFPHWISLSSEVFYFLSTTRLFPRYSRDTSNSLLRRRTFRRRYGLFPSAGAPVLLDFPVRGTL